MAKFLQSQISHTEIRSIAKELLGENISVNADCVGIDYSDITKGRKRYGHKDIKPTDLLRS